MLNLPKRVILGFFSVGLSAASIPVFYLSANSQGIQCSPVPTPPEISKDQLDQAWVQLFDDRGFRDRCLTIRYPTAYSDFKKISSDNGKKGFNDKTSAVRYQIPVGWQAVLYDDTNFKDSPFFLIGTGRVEEIPDVGSYNDKASSITWHRIRY